MSYLELKNNRFRSVIDGLDALWIIRFLTAFPIDPAHCDECARWYQKLIEIREQQLLFLQVMGLPPEKVTHEVSDHTPSGPWSPAQV